MEIHGSPTHRKKSPKEKSEVSRKKVRSQEKKVRSQEKSEVPRKKVSSQEKQLRNPRCRIGVSNGPIVMKLRTSEVGEKKGRKISVQNLRSQDRTSKNLI